MKERKAEFRQYKGTGTPEGQKVISRRNERGDYLAAESLVIAVNTALAVEQPLLLTGEPGTGKTALAWSVASELGLGDVLEFHTRSDHLAKDALYEFDNLERFYDAHQAKPDSNQKAATGKEKLDRKQYVRMRALGEAFESPKQRVVLIDEIDKAPRDFPNDLLDVIDRMAFTIDETGETIAAAVRPVVIITSNRESQLPDPFLRRCVFHYIEFPKDDQLKGIVKQRLGDTKVADGLISKAIERFVELRKYSGLIKKPATHELITWLRVLVKAGIEEKDLEQPLSELFGKQVLLKHLDDVELFKPAPAKAPTKPIQLAQAKD